MAGEETSTSWSNPFGFSQGTIDKFAQVGPIMQIAGTINSAIGSYYAAQTEKYKYRSQALSYEHQRDMAAINSRMIEQQAQQVQRAFDRQSMIKTLQSGAQLSTARNQYSARGIQLGEGSARETLASARIMAEIDRLTINSNKVRAVEEMRMKGVATDISGMMAGVSANNLFASANSVNPILNMTTTMLTGAGNFMRSYYQDAMMANYYSRMANSGSPTSVNTTPAAS